MTRDAQHPERPPHPDHPAPTDPAGRLAALAREGGGADVETGTTARLRVRLAADAERDGVLDVAYRTLDTPVGTLLLAATTAGLVRVVYPRQGHDAALRELAEGVSPRVLHAPARLDGASRQLDEYFAGLRTSFQLPLDLRLSKGFRRTVLDRLTDIAFGRTESYAQVAAAAGSPRAVRAVGTACATNPLPVVVPCHRVVRSDGTAGGYAGGPEAKRALLALESETAGG
jgi:methylated-DNA-[protein]-cysteine S-methyltransferase